MKKFRDNQNREWLISINIGTIKKVKDLCGIDLLEQNGAGCIERLASDYSALIDVVTCLISDQLGDLTPEKFGESLLGDSLELAASALFEDLFDFFPQRRRQILLAMWEKVLAADKEMSDHATAKISNGAVDKMVKARLEEFDRQLEEFGR